MRFTFSDHMTTNYVLHLTESLFVHTIMSNLLCTVCHQTASYDKFLAQHCGTANLYSAWSGGLTDMIGHVFCRDCMIHLNRERKCPTCRREWGSTAPFRVYLNFPESDRFGQTLHHLENINKSSSAFLLGRMSGVIKGLVENPENIMGHDTAVRI